MCLRVFYQAKCMQLRLTLHASTRCSVPAAKLCMPSQEVLRLGFYDIERGADIEGYEWPICFCLEYVVGGETYMWVRQIAPRLQTCRLA